MRFVVWSSMLTALAVGACARQETQEDQWICADKKLTKLQSGVAKRSEAQALVYAEELMLCFQPKHTSYNLAYTTGTKNLVEVDKTSYKVGQHVYASVNYAPWKHQMGEVALFDREVKGLVVLYTGTDYKLNSVDMTSFIQRQKQEPQAWYPLRGMSSEVEGSALFGGSARTLMFDEGNKIRDYVNDEHIAVSRGHWNIKELAQSHDVNLVIADIEDFGDGEILLLVRAQKKIWAGDNGLKFTVDGDALGCHTCNTDELRRFFYHDLA